MVKKVMRAIQRKIAIQRNVNALSSLSDRQLKDIGVSRSDILWVSRESYDALHR